jgi:hypothetical protein
MIGGQNPLKLLYSIMILNTISLPWANKIVCGWVLDDLNPSNFIDPKKIKLYMGGY